ncbi:ABC transporter substrate-binding protein [Protaetiibacter intestinalis]|uniref:Extracellular solute-binding protein n=1 Tax=Protaetiibacter intestinalis TaxID=2419774 RepID=A0A387BAN4_9MICO|nr:extracellular solute-binding protein [Protaetiibacter intestinalis]AYF98196.1 extracellular solute-binding protein [Protaetiibacter intestinalis]
MNKARITRVGAVAAASALAIGGLTACTPSGDDNNDGEVTLTWWHNATTDPQKGLWEDVAAEFEESHPGVKVEVTGYQNEDLQRTLIPNALQSGDAPDIFMVWPGGEVRSQVEAGYLKDLTDVASDSIDALGGVVTPWTVDGKVYALPYTFGIEGIWYNKDLYSAAGVSSVPETLPELEDANEKLRDYGVAPMAVGAGDLWPAGHWWYQFALAACSTDTLKAAIPALDFSDPCWVEAGELLQDFVATNPFQDGFLASSGQQGADSSAGLVANGNAAAELMGHWNAGQIGSLTPDATVPSWLGWYPMVSVPGTAGDPTITMGGGDGFGVSKDAPDVAVELLQYILSDDVQKRYAATGAGIPTNPAAADSIEDPNLKAIAAGLAESSYVQLWLDSDLGPTFGTPLNQAVVNLMAGTGTPEDIVKVLEDTAAAL